MVKFSYKKFIFKYNIIWFSEAVKISSFFCFSDYRQCSINKSIIGFFRNPFQTIHIDLLKGDEDIFADFSKNTQYEIRRAVRDGIEFSESTDVRRFVDFYNKFAKSKNRGIIGENDIEIFKENIIFTMASHGGNTLVMHSYLIDGGKRARLLHSASDFRSFLTSQERAIVGRANRFLHYKDIIYFKKKNFTVYDLGGISIDENDDDLKKISAFKIGFGGLIVQESNFISFPLACYLFAKNLIGL